MPKKGQHYKHKKSVRRGCYFAIRLSQEDTEKLDKLAEVVRGSRADVIRTLLQSTDNLVFTSAKWTERRDDR